MRTDAGGISCAACLPGFDVFVENQGPGVMEKLGLDPAALQADHPSLIYARIKGYGLSGPYSDYRSFDMLAQAAAGLFSLTGEPDGPPTAPVARSATRRPAPTRRWRSSPHTCSASAPASARSSR